MKVLNALLVGAVLVMTFAFLPATAATPAVGTTQTVSANQDEVAYRVVYHNARPYRGFYGHPVVYRNAYYNNYPYVTYYNNYYPDDGYGYGYYNDGYYGNYPYQTGGFVFRINI